jgi:hypothetical protein
MKIFVPTTGMNLRDAKTLTLALGGMVFPKRRTGELVFMHPSTPVTVTHNARRKSASRALTSWLRDIRNGAATVARAAA